MHNVLLVLKYHSDGSCQKLDKSIKPIELNQNYLISPSDFARYVLLKQKNASIYKLRKNLRIFIPKAVERLTNTRNGANFDTNITFTRTRHNRTDLHDNSEHKG